MIYVKYTTEDGEVRQMPITPIRNEPIPSVIHYVTPRTPCEEIFEAVKLYYKEQGRGVPVADAKACLDMIKEEKKPKPEEPYTPPKPIYGTPEFWKEHWAKKKAKLKKS